MHMFLFCLVLVILSVLMESGDTFTFKVISMA